MSSILAFILYNLEVFFFWLLRGWDQVQIVLVSNHIYIVLVSNPPILTYDFDLILGSICLLEPYWAGFVVGVGLDNFFWV